MRSWLLDTLAAFGLALLVAILVLFASFDSTFIYQGF